MCAPKSLLRVGPARCGFRFILCLLGLAGSMCAAASVQAAVFYVDAGRPDDLGDGTSWGAAKKTIPAAITASTSGDDILVRYGTYGISAPIQLASDRRISSDDGSHDSWDTSIPDSSQCRISGGNAHRILTITVFWGQPDDAKAIANAAVTELSENSKTYMAQLGSENAQVHVIDEATVAPIGGGLKDQLDLPIRLGLALAAGVALAFLLNYLDDSVRDAAELEALGFTVLGRIPRRRWGWLPGRRARD